MHNPQTKTGGGAFAYLLDENSDNETKRNKQVLRDSRKVEHKELETGSAWKCSPPPPQHLPDLLQSFSLDHLEDLFMAHWRVGVLFQDLHSKPWETVTITKPWEESVAFFF